ncbi:hypothetical protein CSV67_02905 [Sporosarcina sp. P2]|uniref:hypothetical protein n=1 Tax=Sporosarcina sp. P2 TaxID=2048251 RepID=UPI000C171B27|nr:hypothetical protein [Sporosarcina sp. P2]PID03607.1 hypothetical protein CSV67_02905 [Sporosarcina sp. P2]
MAKVQYKQKTGVLHIGGGRFFYAQEPVEVTAKERDDLLELYSDLEEVKDSKKEEQEESKNKKTKE